MLGTTCSHSQKLSRKTRTFWPASKHHATGRRSGARSRRAVRNRSHRAWMPENARTSSRSVRPEGASYENFDNPITVNPLTASQPSIRIRESTGRYSLSAFIFMLTPETAAAIGERMLIELSTKFPEYEFEFAESQMDNLKNAILPIVRKSREV